MNFNYSYRAFLITSLLTGSLVLFLYSIKLKGEINIVNDKEYDIQYDKELKLPDEEELKLISTENVKIETNKAYNSAEKYISKLENENKELTENTEGKLEEMNQAIENSASNSNTGPSINPEKKEEKKDKTSNGKAKDNTTTVASNGNRNTTISYQLVDRTAMALPNPVYTCMGSGKIVINIEVDATGRIVKTSYNKSSSTTSNECLIDAAIEYSNQARFTNSSDKPRQLGTITFNFPGQN